MIFLIFSSSSFVTWSHDENGRHQGGAAQARISGAVQAKLDLVFFFFHHLHSHENLQILQHAVLWPSPQQGRMWWSPMPVWTIFIAINGRCICSWKEPTVMTPWQNQQQEPLPLAPVWRRLWRLEPSLILLRPALAAPLVRDDLNRITSISSFQSLRIV